MRRTSGFVNDIGSHDLQGGKQDAAVMFFCPTGWYWCSGLGALQTYFYLVFSWHFRFRLVYDFLYIILFRCSTFLIVEFIGFRGETLLCSPFEHVEVALMALMNPTRP